MDVITQQPLRDLLHRSTNRSTRGQRGGRSNYCSDGYTADTVSKEAENWNSMTCRGLHLFAGDGRVRNGNGMLGLGLGRSWCCNGDHACGADTAVDSDRRGCAG